MGVRNQAIEVAYKKGYRVSDCGSIVTYQGRERKLQVKKVSDKEYYRFTIKVDNRTINVLVHRLQAFQKYGRKTFKEKIVVRHKDDNSLNNSKENILLGTQSDNMKERYRNARRK